MRYWLITILRKLALNYPIKKAQRRLIMGKGVELTTTKYLIHAQINANGIVEKPDVVGAVFGQTEGLLSNDLDLRELQRTGRIGRIQVIIHSNGGRAKGEIVIPSSLDRIETAILAASLETINRVGPCEASIEVLRVEDVRAVKRQQVINRAKEIYMGMMETVSPESMQVQMYILPMQSSLWKEEMMF